MTRGDLKARLEQEMQAYAELSYEQAEALSWPIKFHRGTPGQSDFYQVAVRVVQRYKSETEEWMQLGFSVDDGVARGLLCRLIGAVRSETGSLFFHRNGRIDKVL